MNDRDVPMFGEPALKAQLPNILTALRLAMTVAFIALGSLYRYDHSPLWMLSTAIALFVAAAITDFFDGFLARRWDAISVFGRVMDPLADKVLILAAFILLAGPSFTATIGDAAAPTQVTGVWPWMAALILTRELLITSLRGVCESRGIDFSASLTGKLKMVAQSVGIPAILIAVAIADAAPTGSDTPGTVSTVNLVIGLAIVVITAWSAVPYLTRAYRGLLAPRSADPDPAGGTDG